MNPPIALSISRLYHPQTGPAYGMTDIGPVRKENEDNFLIDATLDLLMVADGMGGHAAGAMASALTLTGVHDFLRQAHERLNGQQPDGPLERPSDDIDPAHNASYDPDATGSNRRLMAVSLLFDAVDHANQVVYAHNLAQQRPEGGMGTTLTGFWRSALAGEMVFFHVGDSRLYRQRRGQLQQMTLDQTLYQQALEAGAFENLPARNLLLQAVGPAPEVQPQVRSFSVQAGDLLLLCSDGLHGAVPHGDIEQVLAATTADTLEQSCGQLITLAKLYGGRDNITVLLMHCTDA